jgi:plastocyanin
MKLGIAAVLCCGLVLASCGERAGPLPDAADMQPELTPGGGDLPPVTLDTTRAANSAVVEVTLTEYAIAMSHDSIAAGTVTFNIRNAGTVAHAVRVFRGEEEWETDPYAPGEQVSMSMALTPGTYTIHCPVQDGGTSHTQMGMQRTFRVYRAGPGS